MLTSLKAMRPRTIVLLATFAALAVGNYALSYQDWKVLLIICGFVWVFLAIHGHEEAKEEARQKGYDEGRKADEC
jgi:hypothetical protein